MSEKQQIVTDVYEMAKSIRVHTAGIEKALLADQRIEKAYEVGPNSFVQILTHKPITNEWDYAQTWVGQLPESIRQRLIGAFLNQKVDGTKVIGIFNVIQK